uniref:Uncharacterized protein n=1 Tax=Anguilla anguilla TaxID=7936 RepID=A0A0E9UGD4_ANGAN
MVDEPYDKPPVLARCDVFQHFLSCSDEKARKQGKRKGGEGRDGGSEFLPHHQHPGCPT